MVGPWEDYQDIKTELPPWEDYKSKKLETTQQEVPKWGMNNPNLYGAVEVGKSLVTPLVSPEEFEGTGVTGGKILSPAYQTASRAVGAVGGGGLGPFIGSLMPGGLQQKVGAKVASGETTPLALTGNLMSIGSLARTPRIADADFESMIQKGLSQPKPKVNWWETDPQIKLANETKNTLAQVKHGASESYGIDYDKYVRQSDKSIDTKNIVGNFIKDAEDSYGQVYQEPDFMEALAKKDPYATRIKDLIDKVNDKEISISDQMSVQEADRLQKFIKQLPSIKAKLNTISKGKYADFTNSERLLLELSNDIKGSVIEAHPELKATNLSYGETINDVKNIRQFLSGNQIIENLKKYHSLPVLARQSFERTMPSGIMSKIKDFSSTTQRMELLQKLGLIGLKTAVGTGVAGAGVGLAKLIKGR